MRYDFDTSELWSERTAGQRLLMITALISAGGVGFLWAGSHSGRAAGNPIVYVCTETQEAFSLPPQTVPAVNPNTRRPTLVRGVYCSGCKRWYAAPPTNHRSGNPKPLTCHIHKIAMSYEGPFPAEEPAANQSP
jgi:hypothetical protein